VTANRIRPLLTVWYNTRCPVCDAGISRQKRRLVETVKAGRIEFRDINLEPAALGRFGVSLEDIRRRLHATDVDGRLLVGADVAIAVWQATPGEGWLRTFVCRLYRLAGSHSAPTMRRTIGSTSSSVGNAASQDRPQAVIQMNGRSGWKPRLFNVEMNETMKVISSDSTKGLRIAA